MVQDEERGWIFANLSDDFRSLTTSALLCDCATSKQNEGETARESTKKTKLFPQSSLSRLLLSPYSTCTNNEHHTERRAVEEQIWGNGF